MSSSPRAQGGPRSDGGGPPRAEPGRGGAPEQRIEAELDAPADPVLALLRRALSGDREAENELALTILMPVIDAAVSRYVFGAGRRRFEKEDAAQEVLAHLYENKWEKLRRFDPERGSLVTYVWAIVKQWVRDHSRRRPPPEPVEDPEPNLAPDSGPENKAELAQVMERLLSSLDEEQLLLFQWVHFQGLERADIAERLQISMEAAYKRIQRMDAQVKAALSNPGAPVHTPKERPL